MNVGGQPKSDYGFKGFFALRTPGDLLTKMRYDYERLSAEPGDTYAAFDFFVTANHMPDWIWPSDPKAQSGVRDVDILPRICRHLADGAKHFLLEGKHHGVADIEYVEAHNVESSVDASIAERDDLWVTLEPAEAQELGPPMINGVALARLMLEYWEQRFGRRPG